jgi:N-acetylmuramic acid 6-phosphate etherase
MMVDTSGLQTEQRNSRTENLDELDPRQLVEVLHSENFAPAEAVRTALPQIAAATELIASRLSDGGRLIYVGCGTSGRLGVLDASECPPTFGVDPTLVQAVIAGGDFALRNSIEGAEDDQAAGRQAMTDLAVSSLDIVVGIAASGRTPYVIGALDAARNAGAATVAVVNASPAEMNQHAEIVIAAVTGPEALTGSTRLKAGTAQKMILNLFTTGAMVLIGKTYGNLMVDVRATNEKLRDRARRIVCAAAGAAPEEALKALEDADWSAKTAIVMCKADLNATAARDALDRAGGFVRRALATLEGANQDK